MWDLIRVACEIWNPLFCLIAFMYNSGEEYFRLNARWHMRFDFTNESFRELYSHRVRPSHRTAEGTYSPIIVPIYEKGTGWNYDKIFTKYKRMEIKKYYCWFDDRKYIVSFYLGVCVFGERYNDFWWVVEDIKVHFGTPERRPQLKSPQAIAYYHKLIEIFHPNEIYCVGEQELKGG